MSSFNYKNAHKSHVTRWMRSYIKNTERYIEIIRRLAGSETLVMMRTGPLSHGMLMSSMMTAIRKIGVRQCVPVLDWDFLSHVHVLGPHKHALAVSTNSKDVHMFNMHIPVTCLFRATSKTNCIRKTCIHVNLVSYSCDLSATFMNIIVKIRTESSTGIAAMPLHSMIGHTSDIVVRCGKSP